MQQNGLAGQTSATTAERVVHRVTGEITTGPPISVAQVLICLRFALRALLLAGRLPWLAFLTFRAGLAMTGNLTSLRLTDMLSFDSMDENLLFYHSAARLERAGVKRSGQQAHSRGGILAVGKGNTMLDRDRAYGLPNSWRLFDTHTTG